MVSFPGASGLVSASSAQTGHSSYPRVSDAAVTRTRGVWTRVDGEWTFKFGSKAGAVMSFAAAPTAGTLVITALALLALGATPAGWVLLGLGAVMFLISIACLVSRHRELSEQGVNPHTTYAFFRCLVLPLLTGFFGLAADMAISEHRNKSNSVDIGFGKY